MGGKPGKGKHVWAHCTGFIQIWMTAISFHLITRVNCSLFPTILFWLYCCEFVLYNSYLFSVLCIGLPFFVWTGIEEVSRLSRLLWQDKDPTFTFCTYISAFPPFLLPKASNKSISNLVLQAPRSVYSSERLRLLIATRGHILLNHFGTASQLLRNILAPYTNTKVILLLREHTSKIDEYFSQM